MVREERDTWYQENRFIGRKRVDKGIFEEGTPIPLRLQDEFLNHIDGGIEIKEGEKLNINLILEDISYIGVIR